jgi:cytochrome c oxidase assembly protein subunit 15
VVLTLVLSLVGSAVQVTNGGFSCPDFPLCGGDLWPSGRGLPAQLHVTHRLIALAVAAALVAVALPAWHSGHRALKSLTVVAIVLYVLQFLIGVAQVLMEMHTHLRATHLVLAALLWTAVMAVAATVRSDGVAPTTSEVG